MSNKTEVKEFLTACRAKVSAAQAGINYYSGERRVPGLRREEVAQLAGVSTTYYTRIERGDLSGVSVSVLNAIVRALQLNDAERIHLFNLARNSEGLGSQGSSKQGKVSPVITQLLDQMTDVPAIAFDNHFDVVASNKLGRSLFPDLFPKDGHPLNQVKYLFLDPRAKLFYTDWESTARDAESALRLIVGGKTNDAKLMKLIADVANGSEQFRAWWGGHTVRIHTSGQKHFNHPAIGEMTLSFEVLEVSGQSEIKIVTYLAAPGSSSADGLAMLKILTAQETESEASSKQLN